MPDIVFVIVHTEMKPDGDWNRTACLFFWRRKASQKSDSLSRYTATNASFVDEVPRQKSQKILVH